MNASQNKRKGPCSPSSASSPTQGRNVRRRLDRSSAENGHRDDLSAPTRPSYQPSDDPFNPTNTKRFYGNSDIEFRKAYVVARDTEDPLVRTAVQEIINIRLADGFDFKRFDGSNNPTEQAGKLEEMLEEELSHKICWLLANKLDTKDRLIHMLQRVTVAAEFIHGYDVQGPSQQFSLPPSQPHPGPTSSSKTQGPMSNHSNDAPIDTNNTENEVPPLLDSLPAAEISPFRGPESQVCPDAALSSDAGATSKPLIGQGLDARVQLFVEDEDRVFSLERIQVREVFRKPIYLFAWHALPVVRGEHEEEITERQLTHEIRRRYDEDCTPEMRNVWCQQWKELVKGRLTLQEALRLEDAEEDSTPSTDPHSTCTTTGSSYGASERSHSSSSSPTEGSHQTPIRRAAADSRNEKSAESNLAASKPKFEGRQPSSTEPSSKNRPRAFEACREFPENLSYESLGHSSSGAEVESKENIAVIESQSPRGKVKAAVAEGLQAPKGPLSKTLCRGGNITCAGRSLVALAKSNHLVQNVLTDNGQRPLSEREIEQGFLRTESGGIAGPRKIEKRFQRLVKTYPEAFHDLTKSDFAFKKMSPNTTPCLDMLSSISKYSKLQDDKKAKNFAKGIIQRLREMDRPKGTLNEICGGRNIGIYEGGLMSQLIDTVRQNNRSTHIKQLLEGVLRPFILGNRHAFQSLRDTELVKEWEALTGLKWSQNTF